MDLWVDTSGAIYEGAVQPALYALGLMLWADRVQEWLDFALLGIVQIALVYAVCRPLEAINPVEPVTDQKAIWTDVIYTLLARLGLLPLIAYVALSSAERALQGVLADTGFVAPTLETMFPGLRDWPLFALLLYVGILDFGEYWRHRFQHSFRWWYALHSVHHAQRQMTFWTDDRNHLLDDAIAALWFGALALLIGVPPGQFPLILLLLRVGESLSHANVRLDFGRLGDRLVSGQVDRMLVTPDRVLVLDYKTNRPAPDRIEAADPAYVAQMAVYVAVLTRLYPDRPVEAALVWTDGPKLMPVPQGLMDEALAGLL
jgi:sterol desaturase/sphingolipid hydroxylase (fatty acid hydroxylase superfamily)